MTDPTPEPPPRRLDRAPGDRYRDRPDAPGRAAPPEAPPAGRLRASGPAVAVAAAGAVGFAVLGSFDLGVGLLAVAAFVGWTVGLALVWGAASAGRGRGPGRGAAAALGAGSIAAGLALLWAYSRTEGGVLGPLEYLDQRFGPALAAAMVAAAGIVAGLRGG